MKIALLEEHCSLGCCGRGHCSSNGCECAEGWHGEACNLNEHAWVVLKNATNLRRQALLQEAKSKREQAKKSMFLADVLQRAGGKRETGSVIAQVDQLKFDVQRLVQSAADLELRAQHTQHQDAVKVLGDVAKACSPVANKMSSKELLSASQLNADLSSGVLSSNAQHFSSSAGMQAQAKEKERNPLLGQKPPPPEKEDFGIEQVNPKGVSGIQEGECAELNNCNYRGICKNGECYCQKNWFGPDCNTQREKKTGTWDLGFTMMCAMGGGMFSFVITFCFHNYIALQRRQAESDLGYSV